MRTEDGEIKNLLKKYMVLTNDDNDSDDTTTTTTTKWMPVAPTTTTEESTIRQTLTKMEENTKMEIKEFMSTLAKIPDLIDLPIKISIEFKNDDEEAKKNTTSTVDRTKRSPNSMRLRGALAGAKFLFGNTDSQNKHHKLHKRDIGSSLLSVNI